MNPSNLSLICAFFCLFGAVFGDHSCYQTKSHGRTCSNAEPSQKFYWNNQKFDCLAFSHKGCGGNTNKFDTKQMCLDKCRPVGGPTCLGNVQPLSDLSGSTCDDVQCPSTHVCTNGPFNALCCPTESEDDRKCSDGNTPYTVNYTYPSGSGYGYLFGDSCDDLECPDKYNCVQGKVFAKCCKPDSSMKEKQETTEEVETTTTTEATTVKKTTTTTTAKATTTTKKPTPKTTRKPKRKTTRKPKKPVEDKAVELSLSVDEEPESFGKISGCQVDTLFVLDSSSSVKQAFEKEIQFIESIADLFTISPENHRVAIVEYAGPAHKILTFPWSDFPTAESFKTKLRKLPYIRGTTATARALKVAQDVLKTRRPGVKTLVIIITDGYSWDDPKEPIEQIRQLSSDIVTFAVGVVKPMNDDELLILAGDQSRLFMGEETGAARDMLSNYLKCSGVPQPKPTTKRTTTLTTRATTTPTTTPTTPAPTTTTTKAATTEATTLPVVETKPTVDFVKDPDSGYGQIVEVSSTTPQTTTTPETKPIEAFAVDADPIVSDAGGGCAQKNYQRKCGNGGNSQFTFRWVAVDGKCCLVPYGYCGEKQGSTEPAIREKSTCECNCFRNCRN